MRPHSENCPLMTGENWWKVLVTTPIPTHTHTYPYQNNCDNPCIIPNCDIFFNNSYIGGDISGQHMGIKIAFIHSFVEDLWLKIFVATGATTMFLQENCVRVVTYIKWTEKGVI